MATLARADVDPVDLPHLHLENEPSHVSARPSREFSAYADATLDLGPPPRAPWLGKTLFISTMVGIIAAASVTAVRENAQQPWLAPWLYSASQAASSLDQRLSVWLGERAAPAMASSELDTEPSAQAVAASAKPSSNEAPAAVAQRQAAVAVKSDARAERDEAARPEQAALLPGQAELNERVRLPEVVFVNPEPQERKPAAQAPRGRKLKGRAAKLQARAKQARKASAPVASAAAPISGGWEQARESARAAYAAGRYRDALVAYEQAVRMNPRHGLTLAGLGAARMQTGDAAGAVDAYRRAAATAPTNLTFQIALARAYERQGDDARARETYQRVLRLDRNNVAAQAGLDRL